jgi:hypothetical protein
VKHPRGTGYAFEPDDPDPYEVRHWDGWGRHITLAMLVQAYVVVTRQAAAAAERKKGTRNRAAGRSAKGSGEQWPD